MKKFSAYLLLIFVLFSCNKETELNIEDQNFDFISTIEETTSIRLLDFEIPDKDIALLQKLGFSGSPIKIYEDTNLATGEKYISYLLEEDIQIKSKDLPFMLPEIPEIDKGEAAQYRTTIIAEANNYTIYFDTNHSQLPTSLTSQALDLAIQNYNEMNIGITFTRVGTGNSYVERRRRQIGYYNYTSSIVVREVNLGGAGGRAGFPLRARIGGSGQAGRWANIPFKSVYIDETTDDFGLNVLEHVITHELGHCIGLRHTDFFNRQLSCGIERDEFGNIINPNEGAANVGAINIPGTPATVGIDEDSIMSACANIFVDGEFTNFDIIALNALW